MLKRIFGQRKKWKENKRETCLDCIGLGAVINDAGTEIDYCWNCLMSGTVPKGEGIESMRKKAKYNIIGCKGANPIFEPMDLSEEYGCADCGGPLELAQSFEGETSVFTSFVCPKYGADKIRTILSGSEVEYSDKSVVDKASDAVNSPNHYASGEYEVIDYIKDKLSSEQFEGYCMGNVLKYVSRYQLKNGTEDLEKAKVYLDWAIEERKTRD